MYILLQYKLKIHNTSEKRLETIELGNNGDICVIIWAWPK